MYAERYTESRLPVPLQFVAPEVKIPVGHTVQLACYPFPTILMHRALRLFGCGILPLIAQHVDAWLLKAPIGPHCLAQGSRLGSQRSFRHHMPRKHNPMFFTPFTQRIRKSLREALRNVVMEKIPRLGHLSVRIFPEHFRQCI